MTPVLASLAFQERIVRAFLLALAPDAHVGRVNLFRPPRQVGERRCRAREEKGEKGAGGYTAIVSTWSMNLDATRVRSWALRGSLRGTTKGKRYKGGSIPYNVHTFESVNLDRL